MRIQKMTLVLALSGLLTACSLSIEPTGSLVMLKGGLPAAAVAEDSVEILIGKPEKPHEVVALVNASVDVMDYTYIAEYEAAVLTELRRQAARAGANAVMNIEREVVSGGTLVTTSSYGSAWGTEFEPEKQQSRDALIQHHANQSTRISQSYTVYFRGQAIRYTP